MYGIIYKITNKVNHKIYIGQTINSLATRWGNHISQSKRKSSRLSKISRAINKYGVDSFNIEIIAHASSKDELDKLEDKFIKELDTIKLGYNLKGGGANGKPSAETRQRMSESAKLSGHQPPRTPEIIEKMRQTKIGKPNPRKGTFYNSIKNKLCIINGFIYPNVSVAAICEKLPKTTLISYLNGYRKSKIECEYLMPYDQVAKKEKTYKMVHNRIPVTIAGVSYLSIADACRILHKGKKSIKRLIDNN